MGKKRNHKDDNHYYIQWGIATLILLVYAISTLYGYNRDMKAISKDRVLDKITKQAIQIRGYYEGIRSEQKNMAESLGDFAAVSGDVFSEEVVALSHSLKENGDFEEIYIVKPTGSAIDSEGKSYSYIEIMDYIADLHSKQSAKIVKDADGSIKTIIAETIQSNEQVLGYVVAVTDSNAMKSIIDTPIYSYSIVSDSGLIAENLGDDSFCKVGENVLEVIKSLPFTEGTYTTFNQSVVGGRSASALVENSNKESYYLITQPIMGTNSEVLITVRGSIIERGAEEENHITRLLVLKLIISLSLFVVLLVVIYVINRLAFSKTSMELQNKAETDLLTDLLNKISTERKIKEYISEEGPSKTCMMCVLDIDNFKKINDTMGHAFGDEVLASLGKQIRAEFRVSDIIGRTGGDEFIIFLKDLKSDDTIRKEAERVETFFRNFTVGEYTKYSATASIGAAIYPQDGKDFESLYKAADTALYKAKNRGKNQLAFYSDKNSEK